MLRASAHCGSRGSPPGAVKEQLVAFAADAAEIRRDLCNWDVGDPSVLLTDLQARLGKLELRIVRLDEAEARSVGEARPEFLRPRSSPRWSRRMVGAGGEV